MDDRELALHFETIKQELATIKKMLVEDMEELEGLMAEVGGERDVQEEARGEMPRVRKKAEE